MDFFVRAKAWKLFVLMCAIPFGLNFFVMGAFANPADPWLLFRLMPLVTLVFIGLYVAWLWSLGTRLYEYAPEQLRVKPNKLKFGLIYTSAYMLVFNAFFLYIAGGNQPGYLFFMILPFHLLGMYFMFYSLYYIAKHLVMVEQGKVYSFYHFSGPFFLLWFFPVGIWFIQPRLNRLYTLHRR